MIAERLPGDALGVLERLWDAGHAAYVVGGAVRDALLDRPVHDVDIATDARPATLLALFPAGVPIGAYGTVDIGGVQVTTFRRDHTYRDHRRPDAVTWTDALDEDLARRDFTINALAWGRPSGAPGEAAPSIEDPMGGQADLDARVLRAVGDPEARFSEDALRVLRGARFVATFSLHVDPTTFDAMRVHGPDTRWLSAERVWGEIRRMLTGSEPSVALRVLDDIGALAVLLPELTRQHGVAQAKVPGHDLFDHTLATTDAAAGLAGTSERLVVAALLHDIGKPDTAADGHFLGHAELGARMAIAVLTRLRCATALTVDVGALVREHMFQYREDWTDAAVRRFLRRIGPRLVDDQLRLRAADNLGSGQAMDVDGLARLESRIAAQRAADVPLSTGDLAIDGTDLLRAVGRPAGPWVGAMLARLLDSVISDPGRNRPAVLLADARRWAAVDSATAKRDR